MFYGLAWMESYFFGRYIDKFIALSPCTKVKPWITEFPEWHEVMKNDGLSSFTSNTVNRDADKQLKQVIDFFGHTTDNEPVSTKALSHFLQIGHAERF
jgi:hypothetical protein